MKTTEFILSDLYRYSGKTTCMSLLKYYFKSRSFKYMFWFRLCQSNFYVVRMYAKLMHFWLSRKYSIQIPISANIGYGLYIGHGTSLILSSSVKIGNNCNLSQFTTIGSNIGNAATIGDCVYVGPNVCIVENVSIGSGAVVGAGSVVTKNISENEVFAGCPAKKIGLKSEKHNKFIHNKYLWR